MASGAGRDAAGDLTLLQERSAGTFSTVYVAESRSEGGLARIVAVKHLKEQWTGADEVLDRTRDEARLLSRLQHKNILRVEALITLKGRPAVVMEFVDGVDVKQLFNHLAEQGRPFPPRAAYRIALSVASALDAAWNQVPFGANAPLRVVHRDIKPSNLMVSKEGEVKVLDFGTARFNHEARVAHTSMMRFGSLRYMSPERKEGGRGDHPGDIYGLGLLLIELLSGKKCKVLPVEPSAHDAAIASAVAQIPDVGLPDDRWENTLYETLARMCAYTATERLTASQCVPLLRAFADQARGDSLEALAARIVAPLTSATYGRLGDGPLPSLEPIPTPDPEPEPEPVVADPADPFGMPTERISTSAGAALAAAAPAAFRAETGPTNLAHRQPVAHQPSPPAAAPTPERTVDANPASRPARTTVPKPRPIPPPPPASSGTGKVLILAGLGAFLVVGGLGAAAMALFVWNKDTPTELAPVEAGTTDGTTEPFADAGTVSVSVGSDDSKVRWIKVLDADGNSLGKGRPDTSVDASPGMYTLQVSIVGRPTLSGEFEVTGDMDWTCASESGGGATCTDGDHNLALTP